MTQVNRLPATSIELQASLRSSASIPTMIDPEERDLPVGPPRTMKIAREAPIAHLKESSLHLLEEHKFLPYQYFPVFALE